MNDTKRSSKSASRRWVLIGGLMLCLSAVLAFVLFGEHLRMVAPEHVYLSAVPKQPTHSLQPGAHELGLGGPLLVNKKIQHRDGLIYVPKAAELGAPLPLLVWLHGGGGSADAFKYVFPLAENAGVVILALDARHNTWDGIDAPFGPDVRFIDEAMSHVFKHVFIDKRRLALGGLSDGGAYALAIGRVNGTVFSHLIAAAPGWLRPPAATVGSPKILVVHGIQDNVYSVRGSRDHLVPKLRSDGYSVDYFEFDGPHWLPEEPARRVLAWLSELPEVQQAPLSAPK